MQTWNIPDFLCPVAPFVLELSVTVSVVTLTLISLDRYRAVIHPLRPKFGWRLAVSLTSAIWLLALALALPQVLVYWTEMDANPSGHVTNVCRPHYDIIPVAGFSKWYKLTMATVQYFIPMAVISVAYTFIIRQIWIMEPPGSALDARDRVLNQNKRKVNYGLLRKSKFDMSIHYTLYSEIYK